MSSANPTEEINTCTQIQSFSCTIILSVAPRVFFIKIHLKHLHANQGTSAKHDPISQSIISPMTFKE